MFLLFRAEERSLAWIVALMAVTAIALSCCVSAGKAGAADLGTEWTVRASAADNFWESVTYGNGLFVAVSSNGTDRVMTSPDGATWTARTAAVNNNWQSVTFAGGLFVAVANSGTGNRVMTSPDGITWTSRTSATDNDWYAVTYGNGVFVATGASGAGNRVMTSPDGITWTVRASTADTSWYSVTFGNGLFVALSATGANQIMTSPDGITWTPYAVPAFTNFWRSVTFGSGLFVAVSSSGPGAQAMTSPDGATWTTRTTPVLNSWDSVTYANGLFVAVGFSTTGNGVMTSGDLVLQQNLNVSRTGSGAGGVTSDPAGIDCGSSCSAAFPVGTGVALSASPDTGSEFTGWSGACSGTGSCTVTMSEARSVTADFAPDTQPPAPTPAKFSKVALTPKKKKLKSGKKTRFTVKVTNSGETAGTATVQLKSNSKKKIKVPKSVNLTVPVGGTAKRTFKASSKKGQKGKVTVTAKVGGKKAKSVITLKK